MTASIWKPSGFSPENVPLDTFEYTAAPGQTLFSINPYTLLFQTQARVFKGSTVTSGEILRNNQWKIVGTSIELTTPCSGGEYVRLDVYLENPASPNELPPVADHPNKWLTNNGVNPLWSDLPNTLPSQEGKANNVLKTNGFEAFWGPETFTSAQFVENVAALKALDKTQIMSAYVAGYYTEGDGGGGWYRYVPSDTTSADNGGSVIVATDGGRWYLCNSGSLSAAQFGAVADGDFNGTGTENTLAINRAIKAAWDALQTNNPNDYGGVVDIPAGNWLARGPITLYPGIHLRGAGMYATKLIVPGDVTGNVLFTDATNPPYSNVPGFPTTVSDMAILSQSGGALSANGLYSNKNGCFFHRLWVAGFANNIVLNNTDNLISDFVSELSNYGVVVLQPHCTVSQGVLHDCGYGMLVQNIITATAVSGTSTTIRFPAVTTTPSGQPFTTNDGAFNGWLITIRSGTGAGQQRVITGYVGSTRTATVSPAWTTAPDATSVFDVDLDNGSVTISDIRVQPSTQVGIHLSMARRVNMSNVSFTQTNQSKFLQGALRIENSVDVTVTNIAARSALWTGAANTVSDGVVVNNSSFVTFSGGTVVFWRDGISVTGGQNVTIEGIQSTSNSRRGLLLQGGDQHQVIGGQYSNNGTVAGANDCGIESNNTASFATHYISGVICNGLGGVQNFGIRASLTNNGSNTGQTFIVGGTAGLFNSTANISLSGRTDRIRTFGAFNGDAALGGIMPTTQIVNTFSSGGVSTSILPSGSGAATVATGSLTANTLAQALSLTGAGEVPTLGAVSANATARTIRLQVIVDGVTVFDATTNSISATNTGLLAAGAVVPNGSSSQGVFYSPIRFTSSLVVNVASSLTESGGINVLYALNRN